MTVVHPMQLRPQSPAHHPEARVAFRGSKYFPSVIHEHAAQHRRCVVSKSRYAGAELTTSGGGSGVYPSGSAEEWQSVLAQFRFLCSIPGSPHRSQVIAETRSAASVMAPSMSSVLEVSLCSASPNALMSDSVARIWICSDSVRSGSSWRSRSLDVNAVRAGGAVAAAADRGEQRGRGQVTVVVGGQDSPADDLAQVAAAALLRRRGDDCVGIHRVSDRQVGDKGGHDAGVPTWHWIWAIETPSRGSPKIDADLGGLETRATTHRGPAMLARRGRRPSAPYRGAVPGAQ